jgi:hypothetical protein
MKIAVEQLCNTPLTGSYTSNKWYGGSLIQQRTGSNSFDNFIGPLSVGLARPMEESTPIAMFYPHVQTFSSTIDWVFLTENTAVAVATRRIFLYEYNKITSEYNWKGFITITLPTATAHTTRAFRMLRYLHTTGTVGVSGTAVTGTSTQFSTERIGVGSRIGFGSTDPTQITTWYEITAIGSDTGITINTSAGTISTGTAYVIDELRPLLVTTNATTANGGVFIGKGIDYNDFTLGGTTIAASAAGVDNLKLIYKLSDASTTTLIASCGLGLDEEVSKTSHNIYLLEGTTNVRIVRMNLRSADTITAGQMVLSGANITLTGTQGVTGTISQTNNGRIATTNHGVGLGIKSLYFVTASRIYRAAISGVTTGNTNWQSDVRIEIPPGSVNTTTLAGAAMSSIEYIGTIDRFIITNTTSVKHYITRYPTTSGDSFDFNIGTNINLNNQSTSDNTVRLPVNNIAIAFAVWSENGITHIVRTSSTATSNQMYAVPLAADANFANTTGQVLISPEILTPNNNKFVRVYVNNVKNEGSGFSEVATEQFVLYYRTTGISDNSGGWTLVNDSGDLNITGTTSIQFKIEFIMITGITHIPAKILGLCVVYDDLSTDSHYEPCADLSSTTSKRFAWKFSTAFGTTVPPLQVRLYNAITNGLLDDDNSVTQAGTWEKSIDSGANWIAYNTTDKANDTTFIRYTPASLADNIQVRALLTQL